MTIRISLIAWLCLTFLTSAFAQYPVTYPIVDTHQDVCYDTIRSIPPPAQGKTFYGQDAQFTGNQPAYHDNGDGTISDLVTGLMWQTGVLAKKLTYADALAAADTFSLAGYDDWRLPSIKELYSLMNFSGKTGNTAETSIPYIDTDFFEFRFGGTVIPSERFIDAQYASTSIYTGLVFDRDTAMFGLNLSDGRIKGYPITKLFEVKYVRGNTSYGINDFIDNNDGTITDQATRLMWDTNGSPVGMTWENALAWVQARNAESYHGYSDWRLPNAKELQSIIDYRRSPDATNSPAIDPLFSVPEIANEGNASDYPFYWTGTTHVEGETGTRAVYVAFGRALGFMEEPEGSGHYVLHDVHGAGAQRSDPKSGNPDDYPYGFGPQGDVIRIYNYVRPVRDAQTETETSALPEAVPDGISLAPAFPNPASGVVTLTYDVSSGREVSLELYSSLGKLVATLSREWRSAERYTTTWNAQTFPAGMYFAVLRAGNTIKHVPVILTKAQ